MEGRGGRVDAPAAPAVAGVIVVGTFIVQRADAFAQLLRRAPSHGREGGVMRLEAHDHMLVTEVDHLNLAKLAQHFTNGCIVSCVGAIEADGAVIVCRARRNLLELQHSRADRGGVRVGHHV